MKAKRGAPLMQRLMSRCIPEPNSGCWLWEGGIVGRGYGVAFLPGGKPTSAHRAMLIAHGVKLTPNDVVMHACDMPGCVNPEHLRVGTQGDNMADMNRKGRHRPAYKIPAKERQLIREDDTPAWAVALWFGVSIKTIRNIRRTP